METPVYYGAFNFYITLKTFPYDFLKSSRLGDVRSDGAVSQNPYL